MVNLIGILGVVFGAAGFLIAVYSQYQQRKFEKQLARKEDLREAARKLEDLHDQIEMAVALLDDPRSHEDLDLTLNDLGRNVLAYHHSEGGPATVVLESITAYSGDGSRTVENAEMGLELVKKGECPQVIVTIAAEEADVNLPRTYHLGEFHFRLTWIYETLNEIEDNYSDVLSDFNPSLMSGVQEMINTLFMHSLDNVWETEEVTVRPADYDDVYEIGEDVYRQLVYYEGIESDISELQDEMSELEEMRSSVIQTSYS